MGARISRPFTVFSVHLEDSIGGEQALRAAQKQRETGGVPPERAAALAVFLASEASDGLTGRLISAVYDDWEQMAGRIPEIMDSDLYTLRRVTT